MFQQGVTPEKIAALNDTTSGRVRAYLGQLARREPELFNGRLVLHNQPAPDPRLTWRVPDEVKDRRWQARLDAYLIFLAEHGREPYTGDHASPEGRLAHWLITQRSDHRAGRLPERRARALDEAVPDWGTDLRARRYAEQWETRRADLAQFLAKHGRRPLRANGGDESRLNKWLETQQDRARHGTLDPDRAAAFEETLAGSHGRR